MADGRWEEMAEESGGTEGPLQGVRVLDLSRVVAAPFAAMALGEMGATVVKVERAGVGDDTRHWGPPFVEGESAYYLSVNRNKSDLALDLSRPPARDVVRRMAVEWADVVLENFRAGTLERWGLGLADLREANPRLVTATIRGYPEGDDRPGYDFVVQAGSGLMSLTGPPDGEYYKVGAPTADLSSGLFLLSGILGALYQRERTGRGQHVSISLWEAQVSLLVNANQACLATGRTPPRLGNAHPQVSPYEVYHAPDGPLAIAAGNDGQFRALAQALGHPEWTADPRFAANVDRVAHRAELAEEIDAALAGPGAGSREAVLDRLTRAGVPCGPLRTVDEVLASPEAELAGLVQIVPHRRIGPLPVVRLPWRFSGSATGPRSAPPVLGEHTLA
ncbi:MAG: CaiB/BaiF CoA transferase family protein, partial [Acidimicrobiales bacterium]